MKMKWICLLPFYLMLLLLQACSTVPKEVVELSYVMSNDIRAVHKSYVDLINKNYDYFRKDRLDYLNNEWKPLFIERFVKKGRLVDIARGQVVWSPERRDFTQPPQMGKEEALLSSIAFWSNAAITQLEKKRHELLDPLDKDEEELIATVNDAFDRLYRANAVITAHLNSLREVQEVQDDALKALDLKDIRDRINDLIINASEKAKTGLEKIKELDGSA